MAVNDAARHLALLTRTTEVVNSSLDLQEVLEAIAHEVAAALETDACFVYLYDERADELVLRATHGTRIEDATSAPRMRKGIGITGVAAAERRPIMLASGAHLDPRFKAFPNLREDEYESILAVPILARDVLEGALNVRTRETRSFTDAEIALLTSIASQVGQSIEHAKLYAQARRRVDELEALARISEAVSESLYLEESLEAIVRTTVESLHATGAAVVLEDGRIAWPEGRAGAHAVRLPLRWRGRGIGELVVDRDTPFSDDDRQLLDAIANQAAVALEHGRMALRGVLAQEIHHRVKNNLQTVASLLRLQARAEGVDPQKALGDSVNRILAIAAVHEELTEHREDVVDLAELVDRLRAMLVQGLVAGKEVTAELEPVELAGQRATALALVFSELLSNALEHGGDRVSIALARSGGERRARASPTTARDRDGGRRDGHVDRPGARPRRARRVARARRPRRAAGRGAVPCVATSRLPPPRLPPSARLLSYAGDGSCDALPTRSRPRSTRRRGDRAGPRHAIRARRRHVGGGRDAPTAWRERTDPCES